LVFVLLFFYLEFPLGVLCLSRILRTLGSGASSGGLRLVIPATGKAEVGGSWSLGDRTNVERCYLKNKLKQNDWGCGSCSRALKYKALSSIPNTTLEKKRFLRTYIIFYMPYSRQPVLSSKQPSIHYISHLKIY
jgi:hypothetical protein